MSKIYNGDIGTEFVVDTGSDISTATTMQLKIKKPSGTIVTWDCTQTQTTKITYTTILNDIDEVGKYTGQAYVALPDWQGYGETFDFSVWDVFK